MAITSPTRRYTYDEYREIAERPEYDRIKVELLDGELIFNGSRIAGSDDSDVGLINWLDSFLAKFRSPELGIVIVSSNDTICELRKTTIDHFTNGAKAVWRIYADERVVEVITGEPDGTQRIATLDATATLDGGDALPGFTLTLADLWAQFDAALGSD